MVPLEPLPGDRSFPSYPQVIGCSNINRMCTVFESRENKLDLLTRCFACCARDLSQHACSDWLGACTIFVAALEFAPYAILFGFNSHVSSARVLFCHSLELLLHRLVRFSVDSDILLSVESRGSGGERAAGRLGLEAQLWSGDGFFVGTRDGAFSAAFIGSGAEQVRAGGWMSALARGLR